MTNCAGFVLFENRKLHPEQQDLNAKFYSTARDVHRNLTSLRNRLHDQPYPMENSKHGLTLAEYLVEHVPWSDHVDDLMVAAHHALDRAVNLFPRILGRLALIAEKVEKIAGLRPMPDPTTPIQSQKQ